MGEPVVSVAFLGATAENRADDSNISRHLADRLVKGFLQKKKTFPGQGVSENSRAEPGIVASKNSSPTLSFTMQAVPITSLLLNYFNCEAQLSGSSERSISGPPGPAGFQETKCETKCERDAAECHGSLHRPASSIWVLILPVFGYRPAAAEMDGFLHWLFVASRTRLRDGRGGSERAAVGDSSESSGAPPATSGGQKAVGPGPGSGKKSTGQGTSVDGLARVREVSFF
eukprot:gene274-biopygen253